MRIRPQTALPRQRKSYVRHDSIKRVSSGVGEGSMAIAFVHQYLALQKQMTGSLLTVAA